jgi:kynurenine formamidase
MTDKQLTVQWQGRTWTADLGRPRCLAIPLHHEQLQPNAFFAPLYDASPVRHGDWVGDTREGAAVNFFNVRINPHGNGTHTECVGHITEERYSVHEALGSGFWIARLVTAFPVMQANGDRVVESLDWEPGIEAIILRTQPNHPDKMTRQYGNSNPPYLAAGLADELARRDVTHLLLDLPSVDREEDGGALAAHKAFWQYGGQMRTSATITEMIYVADDIPDGLYLLEIQMPALQLDAVPSRPFIYPLS